MAQNFYIVSHNLPEFPATEIASLAAKIIRTQFKGSKVIQYPLVDGGEGTIEQLITSTLGSFLEVEATSASGEQIIVPIGFAGEQGSIGVMEMKLIAKEPETDIIKKKKGFSGTTFGIGELIGDMLDEGAHSVILGWDEPLAKDAGFGMAQAIGVKFLDSDGQQLDFLSSTPIEKVASVDLSSRSFKLLSSKFYAAISESVRSKKAQHQMSTDDSLFEKELTRIAALMKKEQDNEIDLSRVDFGGSCIEFGLKAFLPVEFRDGAPLALEVANLHGNLAVQGGAIIFFAEKLEDIASDRAPLASREVMRIAGECNVPVIAITSETPKPASESRYKKKHPVFQEVFSLADVPLFFAPLTPDAPHSERRRYFSARLEKLIGLKSAELKNPVMKDAIFS